VHGTMGMKVLKQRREEVLREAELNLLKKALRAERKRPATSRWGLDRGVGPGEGRRRTAQVLSAAEERRLGSGEAAAWANRGTPIR